ncbi:hypothetical protein FPL06_04480 [Xanthomonas citri pv. glycines]|nr:hypothetical protein BHE84_04215 [Xanthomonas citri pv. glycines str. 8ra]ARV24986.1 hypothetical protein A9D66_20855 [Xanthomonas citri pv. glycines str. 12-2]QDR46957.1 hypothetical protein FPK90_21795 [Xanthomonas citri pv. glycines]QDS08940.1 hypothetical protein FPL00_20610 [Xanthomonas citri pv. glycines]QDS13343.1 hypothetical protein FPL03_21320 [Xanthomonas citri pv. glycines]
MRGFCWLAQLFRLSVVVDIPTIQSIGHSSANKGRAFVAHFASYSNRRLPSGRPDGVHRWIRSKSYRTPSPRVVLPLVPCIWSHRRCGKHRRCRDRSALGRPLCQGYAGKDVGQARLSWAMSVIGYSDCRTVRLALARQVDAQRGGARLFSKGFASAALQGFVPTPVRDTWRGSVAASRAISVPRRRSASGAMRQLPPTQPRRGGM